MQQNNARFAIFSLIAINIMIIVAGGFMGPIWAVYVHKIGGDLRTAGNAIGVFSIVIGVVTMIAARIENYFNKEAFFLAFSQAIMVLSYCGYFWVAHPWQLYCVQIGLGIGGAMQSPAIYSLYHDYIPAKKSTSYWGVWNGFYNISVGIGAMISAYIVHRFGMHMMFILLVGLSVFNLFYSTWFVRRLKSDSKADTMQAM